ncbi:MAG: T9SS type A sorting domain-containing protein [Saprospiraceae bacterium]
MDEKGDVKWKVKIDGAKYVYTRTIEVGDELVYISVLSTFYNENLYVNIDSVSLPYLGHETCYVIGLDKKTGEYRNSFGFKGDAVMHNLSYIGKDTLLIYGSEKGNEIINTKSPYFKLFLFHRIGGLTKLLEPGTEKERGIIYPNPVRSGNELKIEAPEGLKIENVSIYNLKGELLKVEKIGENEGVIYIGNIIPGMYLVKISTKEYDYMEKVVVVE